MVTVGSDSSLDGRTNLRLLLPAVLGVTGLAAGCAGDDDDSTSVAATESSGSAGSTDDSSSTNASAPTSSTDASGTTAADTGSTAGSTSGVDSGSESITETGSTTGSGCALGGGGATCDVITEQAACEAEEICLWAPPGLLLCQLHRDHRRNGVLRRAGLPVVDDACDYGGI